MSIETREGLQEHLQWAVQVELSTIPPYLYAMYSIDDRDSEPYRLIRSVVVEEMLHAALAANLLVAVGGDPRFYDEAVLPSYPMDLPHHEPAIELTLERCSPEFIERVCLPIEHPRTVDSVPEDDDYETISQFYLAVEEALERLDDRESLFESPRVDRQLMKPGYYAPIEFDETDSGGLHPIRDLESARSAVETVIHQGEGVRDEHWADPNHHEMTHYYKFMKIADGTYRLGAVRPVLTNPTTGEFAPELRPVSELFNAAYSYMYVLMDEIYATDERARTDALVRDLYTVMSGVLSPLARHLTATPATATAQRHAGPTFEFHRFGDGVTPRARLRALTTTVVEAEGELAQLNGVVESLQTTPGTSDS
ncbi:ferritin-like protein [Haloarcula sp. S1CR25-12]|uniref:Ferritin-like protein n=1 Tax=Haloarcula saliterrae TaxID=2950534 RepID=A0ABU2FDY0_9EURY|nr:ferritin-like protein [Haloarcula sp. S1CR25-12]MDS0260464.1 ferritin-like protein [Haloarcula sp. S1CR25-12]